MISLIPTAPRIPREFRADHSADSGTTHAERDAVARVVLESVARMVTVRARRAS